MCFFVSQLLRTFFYLMWITQNLTLMSMEFFLLEPVLSTTVLVESRVMRM